MQGLVKPDALPDTIAISDSRPPPQTQQQSQLHKYFNAQDTHTSEGIPITYSTSIDKMLNLTILGYNLEAMGNSRTYELIQTMQKQNIQALLVQGTRQRYSNDIKMALPKANPTDETEYYDIHMEECGSDPANIMAGVAIFLAPTLKPYIKKK